MVMSQSTLATQLRGMTKTSVESLAITHLVDAYATFAQDAMAGVIPIAPSGIQLGKTAMSAALVGMSAPGAGLVSIPASIVAFWVAAATVAAFPGTTVVTPPPNAGLATLLAATFPANVAGSLTLQQAAAALAANMYAQAIIGGTVTLTIGGTAPIA